MAAGPLSPKAVNVKTCLFGLLLSAVSALWRVTVPRLTV